MISVSGISTLILLFSLLFWPLFGVNSIEENTPPSVAACLDMDDTQEISKELSKRWSNLEILVSNLPEKSCYKEIKGTPGGIYELIVYPNVGRDSDNLYKPHDFGISILLENVATEETLPLPCISPQGYDDLRKEVFDVGSYRVTIKHTLEYRHDDGYYSNPNPYAPEVINIILKVFKGIRVGQCT